MKRDLSKPLASSGDFDPRDRNKDGKVDAKELAYDKKMKSFKAGKAGRDAATSKAEATQKKYPTLASKELANAKAKATGKPQPFPSVGTGKYSGTGGFNK